MKIENFTDDCKSQKKKYPVFGDVSHHLAERHMRGHARIPQTAKDIELARGSVRADNIANETNFIVAGVSEAQVVSKSSRIGSGDGSGLHDLRLVEGRMFM